VAEYEDLMKKEILLFIKLFLCLIPQCYTELDIEFIILDANSEKYNTTQFEEAVAEFNPVIIVNGTEIPLLFSRPVLKSTKFNNTVLCVNGTCYKEADLPAPPSPSTTPIPAKSNTDVIVISVVSSVVAVALLTGMCCWLTRRSKRMPVASSFHRVVIRESIDLPPYVASHILYVKTGSKHTRGFV
jgi:hypothetical protein